MAVKRSSRKKSAAKKRTGGVKKAATKAARGVKKAAKNPKRTVKKAASNVHKTATRARNLGENLVTAGEVIKQTADVVDVLAQRASDRVEAGKAPRKRTTRRKK